MAQKNTLFYPRIWQKSFLIEIAYSNEPECFTFSLPPESFEHKMTQRLSKTPTFGGLFVDDYGMGIGSIRFSGSTGNSAFKCIYRNGKSNLWLTGKEEIFYFRDRIARYKTSSAWKHETNPPPLYLYNLSTNNSTDGAGNGSAFIDAWEVLLEDFTLSQNKEKPFTYNYAIDFTVTRLIGEPDSRAYDRASVPVLTTETIAGWTGQIKDYVASGQAAAEAARAAAEAARAVAAAARAATAALSAASVAQVAGDAAAEAVAAAQAVAKATEAADKAREAAENADNARRYATVAATQAAKEEGGRRSYEESAIEGADKAGKASESANKAEEAATQGGKDIVEGNYAATETQRSVVYAEETVEFSEEAAVIVAPPDEDDDDSGGTNPPTPGDIPTPSKKLNPLEIIKGGLKAIETWYGWSQTALRAVKNVRASVNRYCAEAERYVGMITGSVENYYGALATTVYTIADIHSSFKRIVAAPNELAKNLVKTTEDMRKAMESLIDYSDEDDDDSVADITYTVSPTGSPTTTALEFVFSSSVFLSAYRITIIDGTGSATKGTMTGSGTAWLLGITTFAAGTISVSIDKTGISSDSQTVTLEKSEEGGEGGEGEEGEEGEEGTASEARTVNDTYIYTEEVIQSIENAANALYVASASPANPQVITFPGTHGETERIVAHGFSQVSVTSETTLEQLAATYLGSPDMALAIALVNKIAGDEAISPGDVLKIPVLSTGAPNSLVFNRADRQDTIGVDIALRNGKFSFNRNGEFATISGQENISQAIDMRLAERLGNRLRLGVYGIRNVVSMPDAAAVAYISASVKDTVLQDPRIDRVENLYFRGRADALYIEFDYYTIDGALQKYQGDI